jgi:hypothetical protein
MVPDRITRRSVVAGLSVPGVAGCLGDLTEQFSASNTSTDSSPTADEERSVSAGQSITTSNAVEIDVGELQAAQTVETTAGTITPTTGQALLLARITAERTGDPGPLPSRDDFAIEAGHARRRPVSRIDETSSIREPVAGDFYRGSEGVAPGERRSGWILFEIPRARSAVSVVYEYRALVSGEERSTKARWNGTVDVDALPDVATTVEVPDSLTWGEETEITFTFENSGGSATTTDVSYSLECPGHSSFDRTESITVDAGGAVTKRLRCQPKTFSNVTVVLGPETYTVPVQPPRRRYGESFELPETASFLLDRPKTAEAYEYRVYPGRNQGDPTKQFVFVRFAVTVTGTDAASIPAYGDFRLTVGGRTYEPIETDHPDDGELVAPVTGTRYTASFRTSQDVGGWLVFEVPTDASVDDSEIAVEWGEQQGGPYRIQWGSA